MLLDKISNPLAAATRERGNVIIEMAIVLPFLLLVVAGVVDLGRLFWEQQVLTNATCKDAKAQRPQRKNVEPPPPDVLLNLCVLA